MNSTICSHCRTALRLRIRQLRPPSTTSSRQSSSTASATPSDLAALLSKPTWSVRSLLPSSSSSSSSTATTATESTTTITPKTLHHLLRLSALPQPNSAEEESQMLSTLESQLQFVRAVREVDTTGVEPLRAIRDETAQGVREQTIGLEELREALAMEDVVGHARRPRRRLDKTGKKGESIDPKVEGWDVLAGASETAGRYFVVRTAPSSPDQTNISQARDTKKV
ncbi:pre-rRNA processing protein [Hypoxylon texense]